MCASLITPPSFFPCYFQCSAVATSKRTFIFFFYDYNNIFVHHPFTICAYHSGCCAHLLFPVRGYSKSLSLFQATEQLIINKWCRRLVCQFCRLVADSELENMCGTLYFRRPSGYILFDHFTVIILKVRCIYVSLNTQYFNELILNTTPGENWAKNGYHLLMSLLLTRDALLDLHKICSVWSLCKFQSVHDWFTHLLLLNGTFTTRLSLSS